MTRYTYTAYSVKTHELLKKDEMNYFRSFNQLKMLKTGSELKRNRHVQFVSPIVFLKSGFLIFENGNWTKDSETYNRYHQFKFMSFGFTVYYLTFYPIFS